VRNLKRLFVKAGKTLPPDLDVFAAYNIWLVAFGIGILRESGFGAVQRLGFSVTFPDKPRFTVIELLPQTKFVKKFGSHVKIETALGLNGSARVPEAVSQVVAQTDVLSADASLCLSAAADLVGTLSFSVFTPTVETIGIGCRRAEWAFEKSERPLLGDQHMFVTCLRRRVSRSGNRTFIAAL
jgi:hypothetical protein